MKKIIVFLFVLFPSLLPSQILLEGNIFDTEMIPIQSVSIRLNMKNIGTISDARGHFSLLIPDSLKSFSLSFTHLNYRTKAILIDSLVAFDKIVLEIKNEELAEVVVVSPSLKIKWEKQATAYLGKTHINISGIEAGIAVKIKHKAFLQQVKFKVKTCDYDSLLAWINIYKFDEKKENIGDLIFSKPVMIAKTSEKDGGNDAEYLIDIDKYLQVINEGIFLSLEFPQIAEIRKFELPAYLGTGYSRKIGGKFKKNKFNQGISLKTAIIK